MAAKQYNPKNCITTINDTFIVSGYAQAMISCNKDNPLVSVVEGAQGDSVVNVSASKVGTITITLQATSPSNAVFMRLAKSREFFSIWCTDKSLNERTGGNQAIMENFPQQDKNDVVGDRVYTIKVLDYDAITVEE